MSSSIDRTSQPRRFAPGWPLWLFTLFFLPLLTSLGVWQLDRAEYKRTLAAQIEQQRQRPALALPPLPAEAPPAWRQLQLSGRFDPQYIWLLDNRTRNGQAGVEVLQLFHDQPSARLLIINRGWLAWPDRRQLPAVPRATEPLQLLAETLPAPASGFRLQGHAASGWPRLISQPDPGELTAQAGLPGEPVMARLQPGSPAALQLEWPPMPMTASRHTGYAVQWFALAAALLILFIRAGYRLADREHDNP